MRVGRGFSWLLVLCAFTAFRPALCAGLDADDVDENDENDENDVLKAMGLGGDADSDDGQNEDSYQDKSDEDGDGLDDLPDSEWDLEDDAQMVEALESEIRMFAHSEDRVVIEYIWWTYTTEQRLAFVRSVLPGLLPGLSQCWVECYAHGADEADMGPGSSEQEMREAWVFFPERTEDTLAGAHNPPLLHEAAAIETLMSNFLYGFPLNLFGRGGGWLDILDIRVGLTGRRRERADQGMIAALAAEIGMVDPSTDIMQFHLHARQEALPLGLYLLAEEARCEMLCIDHPELYGEVLQNAKSQTDLSEAGECDCDEDRVAAVEYMRAAAFSPLRLYVLLPFYRYRLLLAMVGVLVMVGRTVFRYLNAPIPAEELRRRAKADKRAGKKAKGKGSKKQR